MKKVIVCALACLAGGAWAVSCDGTNVWIGAASGGSWSDAANWEAHSSKGYSVEELFHRYTVYDFRNLAPGAVVTMDYEDGNVYNVRNSTGDTFVYGLIFSGQEGDEWTLAKGTEAQIRFCNPSYIDIDGGTLDFQAVFVHGTTYPTTGNATATAGFHKRGTGTLRWGYAQSYFWESFPSIDSGVIAFTNNSTFTCCVWKMASGAKANFLCGHNRLAGLSTESTVAANTVANIAAGATLELVTGFNTYSPDFYGDITGTGMLAAKGGGSFVFHKGAKAGPYSFAGTLRTWNADMTFGDDSVASGVNPGASAVIDASGHVNFKDDQTLACISGKGADGEVTVSSGKTLTVAGVSGVSTSTVFTARIGGGGFVKDGADYDLTLAGANAYPGATRVKGGTLTLDKGFARPHLRAAWRFEDEDDIGAQSAWGGGMNLNFAELKGVTDVSTVAKLVDDGISGKALRFLAPSTTKGVVFQHVSADYPGMLPGGNSPFTVSFWMRPNLAGMTEQSGGSAFLSFRCLDGGWSGGKSLIFRFTYGLRNFMMCSDRAWTMTDPLNTNSTATIDFGSSAYLGDGKWHHVVGTYTNQTFVLYVDGGAYSATRNLGFNMNMPIHTRVYVGNASATDGRHKFAGDIDELQVFDTAWSADEVLAEYTARKPKADETLPDPIAHWTFDEEATENGERLFKDSGPYGWDLVNTPSNDVYASTGDTIYPENLGGKHVKFPSTAGPHLRLRSGVMPTNNLPKGASFTISARVRKQYDGVVMVLGSGTSTDSIRFGFGGCPRRLYVLPCSSTAYYFSDTYVYSDNDASWTQATITYDAFSKTTRYYIDSYETAVVTNAARSLNLTDIAVGAKSISGGKAAAITNTQVDDLRIYDRALTPGEVHRMVQGYRYADAGRAVPTEVLPSTSDVTVDAGATLKVRETVHAVKSLAGAGTALINGSATLVPGDMGSFTGTVTGNGVLRLAGGASAKTAASVSSDVEIPSVVTDVAGSNLPLVRTTGKVTMPATATIDFSDAARAGEVQGKIYVLAEAGSFDLPETLDGWTITPALAEGQGEPKIVVEGGKLKFKMGIQPTIILFR